MESILKRYLILLTSALFANIAHENFDSQEVPNRINYLYGDTYKPSTSFSKYKVWHHTQAMNFWGNHLLLKSSPFLSDPDTLTEGLYLNLLTGNEVGDMLHQEVEHKGKENNRTPALGAEILWKSKRFDIQASFDQIDHFTEYRSGYRAKASRPILENPDQNSVKAWDPHAVKAWFGENLPDHSSLNFSATWRSFGGKTFIKHVNGWLWWQDQGGHELPLRWLESQLSWHLGPYYVKTQHMNWRTENQILGREGNGDVWKSIVGGSFELHPNIKLDPSFFMMRSQSQGLSPWNQNFIFLPILASQIGAGPLFWNHESKMNGDFFSHADTLSIKMEWGALGIQHQQGKGLAPQEPSQLYGNEALATFDTKHKHWNQSSIYAKRSRSFSQMKISIFSELLRTQGNTYWDLDSSLYQDNLWYRWAKKKSNDKILWALEMRQDLDWENSFFTINLGHIGNYELYPETELDYNGPSNIYWIKPSLSLWKGQFLQTRLQYQTSSFFNNYSEDGIRIAPYWSLDVGWQQKLGSFLFWVKALNVLAREAKLHPNGAPNRFRILTAVEAKF